MVQQWYRVGSLLAAVDYFCCQMGAVSKTCGRISLWATLACAVDGPSASRGEEVITHKQLK